MPHDPYFLADGSEAVSVTQVIKRNIAWGVDGLLGFYRDMGLKNVDPEYIRDRAGAVGTYTHRCIELDQEWVPVDDDIASFMTTEVIENCHRAFQMYKQWCERHKMKIIAHELPLVSEKYRYGGMIDIVAKLLVDMNDRKTTKMIVDVKTTSRIKVSHFIQLAAYRELYAESKGDKLPVGILWVRQDQRPTLHLPPQSIAKYWKVFKHGLDLEKLRTELDHE